MKAKQSKAEQSRALAMAVAVLASCGSESEAPASETRVVKQLLAHRDTGISAPDPEVVFYFHKKTGEAESETTEGQLDLDSWHHAARPYDQRAQLSGVAWEEGEWFRSDESGTEQYYHIGKRPAVFAPSPVRAVVRVADDVRALVDQSEPDQRIEVVVRFPGFDIWDVFLKPDPRFLSPEDVEEGIQRRSADMAERKSRFETARDTFLLHHPSAVVKDEVWTSGTMLIEVPSQSVLDINVDLAHAIELPTNSQLNACSVGGCSFDPTTQWRLGQGRSADRIYVEPFHDGGIYGAYGNSARHSYGAMTVGVIDHGWYTDGGYFIGWEDDYRGMLDSSFQRRYAKTWNCTTSPSCTLLTGSGGFPDFDIYGRHGAQVSSVIASDFELNQGGGYAYDDVCYDPPSLGNGFDIGHCDEWERSSSGMAPRAKVVGYGFNRSSVHVSRALSKVLTDNLDVVNMSFSNNVKDPDPPAPAWCPTIEAVNFGPDAENAFDDGVFVVNAPRNSGGACKVDRPGNVPKVFTVGALDTEKSSACRSDYEDCQIRTTSPSGGLTAHIPGNGPIASAISAMDLVAPGRLTHLAAPADYNPPSDIGTVNYSYIGGTSQAAPHVAGSAALLKEHFLRFGHSFVNSPGRLHAMMLGMGDRYNGTGYSINSPSDSYGLGRLKMRYLTSSVFGLGNPFGWSVQTRTLTPGGGNVVIKPWGTTPLPSNAEFLKCVMYEAEDTSDDEFSSDVYLKVTLSTPVSGSCATSIDPLSTYDASYDLKHVAAPNSPEGRCVEVELINMVIADSSLMTNTFCYYTGVNDHEE